MAGMVIFCDAVGCVLVGLVVAEIASDGLGSLSKRGRSTLAVLVAVGGAGALVGIPRSTSSFGRRGSAKS